jgi:biopolymer transport protein ExbD
MINVVFLLLIFFMMTARIVPSPPFDLTLPNAVSGDDLAEETTLYLSADGLAAFGGHVQDKAWAAIAAAPPIARLAIRADAGLPAHELASVLTRLAGLGVTAFDLAVQQP